MIVSGGKRRRPHEDIKYLSKNIPILGTIRFSKSLQVSMPATDLENRFTPDGFAYLLSQGQPYRLQGCPWDGGYLVFAAVVELHVNIEQLLAIFGRALCGGPVGSIKQVLQGRVAIQYHPIA